MPYLMVWLKPAKVGQDLNSSLIPSCKIACLEPCAPTESIHWPSVLQHLPCRASRPLHFSQQSCAVEMHGPCQGQEKSYTWPGSNWRPSACEADVIATRPQVLLPWWHWHSEIEKPTC